MAGWGTHPVAATLRARVIARCIRYFPPDGRILDLGCGPGLDASLLGALGYSVLGIDGSAGMVAEARGRGVDARQLPAERVGELAETFDGVLSDFGALNCVDLDRTLAGLRARTHPDSVVIAVVMGPFCAAETLALLTTGRPRAAWRRRTGRVVPLEGGLVPVTWPRPADLARAGFVPVHVEALGLLVAPPDLGGVAGRRLAIEPWFTRLPLLRGLGDHTLVVLRRADRSVGAGRANVRP